MSIKGLITLREELHNRSLRLRSIDLSINTLLFSRLWEDSTDDQKEAVTKMVEAGLSKEVMEWIRKHEALELGEKSTRQLKEIAQKMGLLNYSRMDKSTLLMEIRHREKG